MKVARRFANTQVELVGLGSACEYHSPDAAVVQKNIDETKAFIQLCHDVGGGGVKVRPNGLPPNVPPDQTLEQIGRSLREVAQFGSGYGVQVRLEVHGRGTSELANVRRIMEVADHKNAVVCWNSNEEDLAGRGLEHNFRLVQEWIGIYHIHDLVSDYPWQDLFVLAKKSGFDGWMLLEEGQPTADPIRMMKYYRKLWEHMTR
jgi:sugar phosphate isomerase/epimerase